MGKTPDEWSYGDLDAGFKNAALVLDETFVTPNTSHQTLEPRTAMAYWQNGKLYIHCSTQSVVQTVGSVSRWLHLDPKDVVVISQYTGGGFGSKATGTITSMIPALLSKKLNAPVMMRIDRETEHYIGGARPAVHGRLKVGFAKDGRITALDMFVVNENGPYEPQGDTGMTGRMVSLLYQPPAMRWRGVSVLTNTPPRRAQSQPGGMQGIVLIEPILAKAARKLGVDQVAIHRVNAPEGKAKFGPANPRGERAYATSAFVKEALDRGAELFRWDERKAQGGKRQGSKVRGYGVATSAFVAGSTGYDGLFVIKPDGRMYDPVGHRQPRHRVDERLPSRLGRDGRHAVGESRPHLGPHRQEPAVELRLRRQPDDARAHARGACGGHRRDQEAAGDRGEGARRQARSSTRSPTSASPAPAAA